MFFAEYINATMQAFTRITGFYIVQLLWYSLRLSLHMCILFICMFFKFVWGISLNLHVACDPCQYGVKHASFIFSWTCICSLIVCTYKRSSALLNICNCLWENPPLTHKDKYLEIHNSVIQSVISREGSKLHAYNSL